MSLNWEDAVAHALTLPDTVLARYYGAPAVKVAGNGRAFLSRGHEAHESFCVQIDREIIAMLMATDPTTFYQTPHYAGWDAVLVRYATDDPERVRRLIAQAHDRAAAKKPVRPRKG